jgi:hypothetical protein
MTGVPPPRPRIDSFAPHDAGAGPRPKPKATSFLGGAIGRLLPVSIPFRYFGAAVVFHALAWAALLAGADAAPRFAGGLGWPLAALHLVTLGVLVMTALGASMQLLPVATRQSVYARHAPALIWWLYTPGVAVTTLGMGLASPRLLASGGVLVAVALAMYAVVLARNLFGARGMPAVVAHGWVAWASLAILLVAALSLTFAYVGGRGLPSDVALALHVPFAGYGFIGMLALGLSYIVVPLFALSQPPSQRDALGACAFAAAALALVGVAAFGVDPVSLRVIAIAAGALAVVLHLHSMRAALQSGMRSDLGLSFRLVRVGWVLLAASLVAALAVTLGVPFAGMSTLFGATLVAGWLLTFLLGVLQRIVPFLASMHAARGRHLPPTPSALGKGVALRIHYVSHLAALGLLALAIVAGNASIMRAAAVIGFAGALAFLAFFANVVKRVVDANAAAKAPIAPA